jgi:hypothetical protein
MDRRDFLRGAVVLGACVYEPGAALAQFQPLYLRLVRRTGWEQLMGRNKCVIGDLYVSAAGFPLTDFGRKLCTALELAYRNNLNAISSVPAGDYEGFVRTDGKWRIELKGTAERKNIQIHIGNRPAETMGCILPGMGESTDASCFVADSGTAMKLLKAEFGTAPQRPIGLRIQ